MLDNWVFVLAAILIGVAEAQFVFVLFQQRKAFKNRTSLQPLKWLLFGAVLLLMIGAAPLMFVYLNIVYFHFKATWIVYLAVLMNAFAKIVSATLLNLVYRFRSDDDNYLE